jgi:hypothetical protein
VVHAVLHAGAPDLTVINLTHEIAPFDVRAGAQALARAVPFLTSGVVLAVVDPGVGSDRRALCLEVARPDGPPCYFVGPDNGLLVAPAELAGEAPITRAFVLADPRGPEAVRTFDGRDVFAPAAAALCRGEPPDSLGLAVDPAALVRLAGGVVEHARLPDGRRSLRAEVTWVDRFGNVQLAATLADARTAGVPTTGRVLLVPSLEDTGPVPVVGVTAEAGLSAGTPVRCVDAFAALEPGELGLLMDANGHLAVVAGQASAARWLGVAAGALLTLAW